MNISLWSAKSLMLDGSRIFALVCTDKMDAEMLLGDDPVWHNRKDRQFHWVKHVDSRAHCRPRVGIQFKLA